MTVYCCYSGTNYSVLLLLRQCLRKFRVARKTADPVQINGTLEPRWYQVPGNLIQHTKPTFLHLERFNIKHTSHGTHTLTTRPQMDPRAPATYGNLLFKLHLFLSKLCQTRNLPYFIHIHTYTHTRMFFGLRYLSASLTVYVFPSSRKTPLLTPLLYIRLCRLFLPFNAKHGHTHIHTQNPLPPS
jgi:hypothetical protein